MTIKVKMNNQTSLVDTMLGIIVQLKRKDNSFREEIREEEEERKD